jgi:hypothetical protein
MTDNDLGRRDQSFGVSVIASAQERALTILREFELADADLKGKAVVLSNGKAGSVEKVKLDELHGLRIAIAGHQGEWPISTVRLVEET